MYLQALLVAGCLLLSGCDNPPECDSIIGRISNECRPAEHLTLSSWGGNTSAAIYIANRTQFVYVLQQCYSACVMIASRADTRYACSSSLWGLHQASTKASTERQIAFYHEDERINAKQVEEIIRNTPYDGLFVFGPFYARQLGLIDHVSDC